MHTAKKSGGKRGGGQQKRPKASIANKVEKAGESEPELPAAEDIFYEVRQARKPRKHYLASYFFGG